MVNVPCPIRNNRSQPQSCSIRKKFPRAVNRSRLAVLIAMATVAVNLSASTTLADDIKLGGFWIENVSILGIEKSHVLYVNRIGTELSRPLRQLQGLKLTAYPQLAEAEELLGKGQDRKALLTLQQVHRRAATRWLKQWVGHMLTGLYDQLDMPIEAVDSYLSLANEDAPPFYLSFAPIRSASGANEDIKSMMRKRIATTSQYLAGRPGTDSLQELLAAISPDVSENPVIPINDNGTGLPPDIGPGVTPTNANDKIPTNPVTDQADVTLPSFLPVDDDITRLLINGLYDRALERMDKLLETDNTPLDMRLYQRGVAQLALAATNEADRAQYLNAGLSFMSVLAYFPQSEYAGPSLVEAGLVHQKIGRPDTAQKLYDKATIFVNAEDDPRYAARLQQLINDMDR